MVLTAELKVEARACWAVAFDGLRIPPEKTESKPAPLAGVIFFHVLGQFAQLLRGYA